MKLEISSEENSLLISALTCKLVRLGEQRSMFVRDGMTHWVVSVDAEIVAVNLLKSRLFQ